MSEYQYPMISSARGESSLRAIDRRVATAANGDRRTARDARVIVDAGFSMHARTRADRRDDGGGRERMDDDEEYEWVFVETNADDENDRDAADDADDAREEGSRHRHRCDASSSADADADDEAGAREDVSEVSEALTSDAESIERARETASRAEATSSSSASEDGFVDETVRRLRARLVEAIAACRRAMDVGAAAIEASWRRARRLFDTMTRRWKDRSLPRDVGVDIVCVTTAAGVIFLVHRQFFRFDDGASDGVFRRKDVSSPQVFDRGVSRGSRACDVDFGKYFRDRSL